MTKKDWRGRVFNISFGTVIYICTARLHQYNNIILEFLNIYSILSAYGQTKSQPGKSCKDIADTLRKTKCPSEVYSPQNTFYWVKVQNKCTGEDETIQVKLLKNLTINIKALYYI